MKSVPTELNATNDLRELVRVLGLKRSGGEDYLPEAGVDDQVDYALLADRVTRARTSGWSRRSLRIALVAAAAVIGMVAASLGVLSALSTPAAASPPMLSYEFSPTPSLEGAEGAPDASADLKGIANKMPQHPAANSSDVASQVVLTSNWMSIESYSVEGHSSTSEYLDRLNSLHPNGSMDMYESPGKLIGNNGKVQAPSSSGLRSSATVHESYGPTDGIGPSFVEDLPRDPTALKEALLSWREWSETRFPDTFGLVVSIAEIYKFWVVPDDLSRAMWLMLSMEDDITALGRVDDRLGRVGKAFEYALPGARTASILIVSPETGALLGFERVDRNDKVSGGLAVAEFTTIVSSFWEDDSDDS